MKILYYCWDEITSFDITDVFNRLGYEVTTLKYELFDKLWNDSFCDELYRLLDNDYYDCIFSFNYYPVISKCANTRNVKYVSWVYDSPHLTLYSKTIFNPCNYIFGFDYDEVTRLLSYGVKNIYHMPLAANVTRLNALLNNNNVNAGDKSSTDNNTNYRKYSYDISFLGRLYDDETNFYNQIGYLPPYYKGFFEGIFKTQMNLYGIDLASALISPYITNELSQYIKIDTVDELFIKNHDFLIEMIQKKITEIERTEILQLISERYNLTHFAPTHSVNLPYANYGGYVDYISSMPYVFKNSKININISLRSILSGVPLRCIDIMGAGGFLLSNYQKELTYLFEPDRDLVLYDSRTDLINKIDYYLSHDEEREAIAQNGKAKIEKHFDYMQVVPRILDIVFAK